MNNRYYILYTEDSIQKIISFSRESYMKEWVNEFLWNSQNDQGYCIDATFYGELLEVDKSIPHQEVAIKDTVEVTEEETATEKSYTFNVGDKVHSAKYGVGEVVYVLGDISSVYIGN